MHTDILLYCLKEGYSYQLTLQCLLLAVRYHSKVWQFMEK